MAVGLAHVSFGTVVQSSLVNPSQSSSQALPQSSVVPQHAPQLQLPLQSCVPPTPQPFVQARLFPGEQAPPPTHEL
jgi:hypothetical protein